MSQEEEFAKWLRRKEKSFEENLKFAIKSWQSVEFTLPTKYELVLQWLAEQKQLKDDELKEDNFKELLQLRAQPGLITQTVKKDFVEWFLAQAKQNSKYSRKWPYLLQLLVEYELLQDLYRMDYNIQCRVYGQIFSSYEKYLLVLQEGNKQFLSTFESEFFVSLLKGLKETIKRCGDVVLFEKAYTAFILHPMAQVLLILRIFKVDFFDEFLELENLLCLEMNDEDILNRMLNLSLPIRLLCFECAIVNRRGVETFIKLLLHHVFHNFLQDSYDGMDPSVLLTVVAFVIEMLGRHDVSLNIKVNDDQTAIKFLGEQIFAATNKRTNSYLKEILMVLCATLRLNPLILEQNVFEITAIMILAPKSGNKEENELFEEYLLLLMDMFRRLSRAEKFVGNLLKALNKQLKITDLNAKKKRKAISDLECETPKHKKHKLEEIQDSEKMNANNFKYFKILIQDFFKPTLTKTLNVNMKLTAITSFPKMQNFWPSCPVGLAFSKIIMGLMSKPSLTIWKTLLYALKELIESLISTVHIEENSLFQLEFHTALLSQYFSGCKLAEQSANFLLQLQQQRGLTFEVLKLFGKFVLEKEHQSRTISAFLELVYFATNFELLLIYYRPDGCMDESLQPLNLLKNLHNFLTSEEWELLHRQVLNDGKSCCKHLLHRLSIQKSQATFLLSTANKEDSFFKSTDPDILNFLLKSSQSQWYLQQMQRKEKVHIADFIIGKPEHLPLTLNDLELLELVSLAVYENICKSLNCKHSLLKSLSCEFNKIRQCTETTASELIIKELVDVIVIRSEKEIKVKNICLEDIKINLDLLTRLSLGQLRRQRKTIIFALHLCLYHDLKAAQEDELAAQSLEILKDLLHFGQKVLIFKYFPTSLLLKLLPADNCWELYEFIFSTIHNEEKGTDKFLEELGNILTESQTSSGVNGGQRKLLLSLIETLTSLSGPTAKHMRKHLDIFLKIFSLYLKKNFTGDGTSKKEKKFVQNTLSAFASYASVILTKYTKDKQTVEKEEISSEATDLIFEINDDFRRISKIFIGNSMDYRNPHAVRLVQVALNHRELLHLDQDEIEFVLTNYWSQINTDSIDDQGKDILYSKNTELAVKMIIENKTNEDLLLLLKTISKSNVNETKFSNILRLLALVAKCPFSTIKGAIFNEQYKQTTLDITLRLARNEQQMLNNYDLIKHILNCHRTVLDNKTIPISMDTVDSILSFLMDINIKKFPLDDTNLKEFHTLHMIMTEVCSSFIKYRHVFLLDRIPQYMHIFKDLLQAIVWYKSERQKDVALSSNEIDDLSELALKLEALMHLIGQHRVSVKRVAPFVLTFTINLMVGNKRPTTLYNKIKTHIENICYELVGICDHRVGRFILRCSNDAGRQLYEAFVKDYQKYHKFKGKV